MKLRARALKRSSGYMKTSVTKAECVPNPQEMKWWKPKAVPYQDLIILPLGFLITQGSSKLGVCLVRQKIKIKKRASNIKHNLFCLWCLLLSQERKGQRQNQDSFLPIKFQFITSYIPEQFQCVCQDYSGTDLPEVPQACTLIFQRP